MKLTMRGVVGLMVLAGLGLFVATAGGKMEGVKGEEVQITGKLTCSFCKLSNPEGECPEGCCAKCIQAGDPPLLSAADGQQYFLLTNEKQVPLMNEDRMKKTGHWVTAKGLLVKGKGIQAIFVDSLEDAMAPEKMGEMMKPEKGHEMMVEGKLTCTFCRLSHPDMECGKGCCAKCMGAGDPPLLTDNDGNMYVLLTNEKQVPLMTEERKAMAGKQVKVKGVHVQGNGVQVIFVDTMEAI